MFFKNNELRLLNKFYISSFLKSFSGMILPFIVIYFRELNFSFFQISIINTVFSISMILFELPTGAFADKIGRKNSLIIGHFISSFAILLMFFSYNFWLFLFSFILFGLGSTFISGSEESLAIDNLLFLKRKDLQKEYFIKTQSFSSIGNLIGLIVGGIIVKWYHIKPLWIIWAVGYFISGAIFLIIKEKNFDQKKEKIKEGIFKNIKSGFSFIKENNNIKYFLLSIIFINIMITNNDYWPPFLKELNMPVYLLSYIFAINSLLYLIIPFSIRRLEKYEIKKVFTIIILLRTIILIPVLFLYQGLFSLGALIFILSEAPLSLRVPLIKHYFHKEIPTKIRATLSSIQNIITQLAFSIGLLITGFLADIIALNKVIPLTSIFGLIGIYYLYKIKE